MNHENNQCCAVIHSNKRCPNQTINHSNHCSEHIQTATKLYVNYKKICDTAYNLEIDKQIPDLHERFKYLYECYNWFNRAFHARLQHRRYAFVPECYDDGHNKQFTFILEKMKTCEDKLSEIYQVYEELKRDQDHKYIEYINNTEDIPKQKHDIIESIPETIKKKKTKRDNNEKEETRLIEKYYKENMERLEERNKLNYVCFNIITGLVEHFIDIDDINMFEITVLIHHLILELYSINYFDDNYTPEKCKDCKCNNYVSYDVRLACGCIYQNNTLEKYLNLMSESTIKKFCEILIFNKKKLIPLVGDLLNLHKKYEEDLLIRYKVTISWNKEFKRLYLTLCLEPEPEKMSKIMARMRMKKKHYIDKFGIDYDSSSDSEE